MEFILWMMEEESSDDDDDQDHDKGSSKKVFDRETPLWTRTGDSRRVRHT